MPAAVAAIALLAMPSGAAPVNGSVTEGARDVVFVANAEEGTVSILDARAFGVLAEIDVLPDGPDAQVGEDDPVQAVVGQRVAEAVGGDNWVQDQDVSPDGRTLYVSRGHRGDVAAFDIATGAMRWKTSITGVRADHMTISDDGSRLYVSALTTDFLEVLDTTTGAVLDRARTAEWPHDNHLSGDGARLYNASIGNIAAPAEVREARTAAPAVPPPYQVTVFDAQTLEVLETHDFDAGIRPFALTADEQFLYAQLSEYHGVVEYDLQAREITRRLDLPIDAGVTEADYDFEAPHHGLATTHDETTLCLAGRASDYVALADTATMTATAIIDVGDAPSWAETTPDGRHCAVANNRDGTVSIVSYAQREEVARVEVGLGPKHLVSARLPADVVAVLMPPHGAGG
jgi:DNA-binding beta-propeller fold protein YncE